MASFNSHAGVDGWGRPFDPAAIAKLIDADVIVVQEAWSPEGAKGVADVMAEAMGASVVEVPLGSGAIAAPPKRARETWGPSPWLGREERALRLDGMRPSRRARADDPVGGYVRFDGRCPVPSAFSGPPGGAPMDIPEDQWRALEAAGGPGLYPSHTPDGRALKRGTWGVAIISRLPIGERGFIDLGKLRRDSVRRAALVVEVQVGGSVIRVVGTHLSHLTHGSPFQLRRLATTIPSSPALPGVICGDMNLWGPVVGTLLPGWRRAVKGPTWPAHWPHSQLDHLFVNRRLKVVSGEVIPVSASDHRPVRAVLSLP